VKSNLAWTRCIQINQTGLLIFRSHSAMPRESLFMKQWHRGLGRPVGS